MRCQKKHAFRIWRKKRSEFFDHGSTLNFQSKVVTSCTSMQNVKWSDAWLTQMMGYNEYISLLIRQVNDAEENLYPTIFLCPWFDRHFLQITACMLCTSQFQNCPSPPPRAIPGHLTRAKFRTVGDLTQKEARPVGHLTFVSKRLSAVRSKRISQFFDSAREPHSRVIVDSTWVFLLLSFYIVISWHMLSFKVWSEDKLNKKFVVAENFAELVSQLL